MRNTKLFHLFMSSSFPMDITTIRNVLFRWQFRDLTSTHENGDSSITTQGKSRLYGVPKMSTCQSPPLFLHQRLKVTRNLPWIWGDGGRPWSLTGLKASWSRLDSIGHVFIAPTQAFIPPVITANLPTYIRLSKASHKHRRSISPVTQSGKRHVLG